MFGMIVTKKKFAAIYADQMIRVIILYALLLLKKATYRSIYLSIVDREFSYDTCYSCYRHFSATEMCFSNQSVIHGSSDDNLSKLDYRIQSRRVTSRITCRISILRLAFFCATFRIINAGPVSPVARQLT